MDIAHELNCVLEQQNHAPQLPGTNVRVPRLLPEGFSCETFAGWKHVAGILPVLSLNYRHSEITISQMIDQ